MENNKVTFTERTDYYRFIIKRNPDRAAYYKLLQNM